MTKTTKAIVAASIFEVEESAVAAQLMRNKQYLWDDYFGTFTSKWEYFTEEEQMQLLQEGACVPEETEILTHANLLALLNNPISAHNTIWIC
jgi:hypothetical protein